MIKKILIFAIILICSVTCTNHNSTIFLENDYKTIHRVRQCEPDKQFPQMVLIPYFKNASQIIPNCDTYPMHQTAFALFIFYHQWLEYFEDNNMAVRGMLENVMIEWDLEKRIMEEDLKTYNIRGESGEGLTRIIGLVKSKSMIWVWQGYDHRISESALIHELVHLAIRAKNGKHGDPDHEGLKYRGWTSMHTKMIIEAKQILRAFEI
jgi:hypothetical protein|tara:strand:- start:22 stop:645 length:624 start_codon:yes stop_codon:yes gene_type:complete